MGLREKYEDWKHKKKAEDVSSLMKRANALMAEGKYDEAFDLINTASKLTETILSYTIKRSEKANQMADEAFKDLMVKLDRINAKQSAELEQATRIMDTNPFARK